MPDLEQLVIDYLAGVTAVTAITDQIGTRTPLSIDDPWIKVTTLDDAQKPGSPTLHLIDGLVQIDCYAGSARTGAKAEASALALKVREAIVAMPAASGLLGVVTSARVPSLRPLPDEDFDPARDRYILTCELVAHPS